MAATTMHRASPSPCIPVRGGARPARRAPPRAEAATAAAPALASAPVKVRGKTAVVTGASQGSGRAVALSLARRGYNVALCSRTEATLEATQAELAAVAGKQDGAVERTFALPTDLTSAEDVAAFADQVSGRFEQVDLLINCAGVCCSGSFEDTCDAGQFESQFESNLMTAVRPIRAFFDAQGTRGQERRPTRPTSGQHQQLRWQAALAQYDGLHRNQICAGRAEPSASVRARGRRRQGVAGASGSDKVEFFGAGAVRGRAREEGAGDDERNARAGRTGRRNGAVPRRRAGLYRERQGGGSGRQTLPGEHRHEQVPWAQPLRTGAALAPPCCVALRSPRTRR